VISCDDFARAVSYLRDHSLVSSNSVIHLYNWGDPLLHPDLPRLIELLNESDIGYALSTNASKPVFFRRSGDLRRLALLAFSVPGFSQKSYDRIHGFNFPEIRRNIARIVTNYRDCGFRGQCLLFYHVYQFNLDELPAAEEFTRSLGIELYAYLAYFNSYEMFRSYLDSTMPHDTLKRASRELLLSHIDEQLAEMPSDFRCPEIDQLVLDEKCNVLTCCVLDYGLPGISVGSLFDLPPTKIRKLKASQPICEECRRLGLHYLIHNIPRVVSGGLKYAGR